MHEETLRHEKIRFRRGEIADLGALPSALGQDHERPVPGVVARVARIVAWSAGAVAGLFAVAALTVYMVGVSGIGTESLRAEAEKAIKALTGSNFGATLAGAHISLDGSGLLALEVSDAGLAAESGDTIVEAGTIRFGVRFLPLLSGKVKLGNATVSDARIMVGAVSGTRETDWTVALRNERGLLDPDKIVEAVFRGAGWALDTVVSSSAGELSLQNIDVVLPEEGRFRVLRIENAVLVRSGRSGLSLTANLNLDGRPVTVDGDIIRDAVSRRVSKLALEIAVAGREANPVRTIGRTYLGEADLTLSGEEGIGDTASTLTLVGALKGSELDLGDRGLFNGDVDVRATLASGSGKLEISRLHLTTGRSTYDFNGAVGPVPPTGDPQTDRTYRYELISTDSVIAPADSPEAALKYSAKLAGHYDPEAKRLTASEIGISTGSGVAIGMASIDFTGKTVPGMGVAFSVRDMPISQVKQLWPWLAAQGPRSWVLRNVFGGRVSEGHLEYRVAPDRLGNGVPLSAAEVSGLFRVEGARFDTAGGIPPIRDARGTIDFRGNDADIALESGNFFMPSGRFVSASNGKLTIRQANRKPVIGKLDLDIAGEAPAVAELASYEPINAMKRIGFAPEDFSGLVTGNVKADIPLTKGIDRSQLDWLAALEVENLSVAKPFNGQMVSGATGIITVDREKAVIAAKAKLNGAPAQIDLVEPLGNTDVERRRSIAIDLDDDARKALAPGLAGLVSGLVKVNYESAEGRETVAADLTRAKLNIPWAGWSKGAGVAANASFGLERTEGATKLTDFELGGKSFAVKGTMTISDGGLALAEFKQVRLNRGDDVSVSVRRKGKAYQVDIDGAALDVRSLIRQFTSDAQTATRSAGSGSVSVTAKVGRLTGFRDEILSDVALEYSGSGARVAGLNVSARTGSGARVAIRNTTEGQKRTLQMQSADAGAILRFLDIYGNMEGGTIRVALSGTGDGPLRGQVEAREFWVVNESRLGSIVSNRPQGDSRSLNEAVRSEVDTRRVRFDRGYVQVDKGKGYLKINNGVLRGPLIGTTFQGTLYDQNGRMSMTGTFMPAYGINRIFGELPLVGAILGNGRDRGLIGVTYKLEGKAKSPQLYINPLSIIAPGIFRQIFEYN